MARMPVPDAFDLDHSTVPADRPVLIAGPTASGKSALALNLAETQGGVIVNADSKQVFDGWRILTARPPEADLARAPHALYGHVPATAPYSVGDWLRDLDPLLEGPERPIIVGGTGLYFAALTLGLAEIPPVPDAIRAEANALPLERLVADLDPETAAGLDLKNRARVQRAWEVARATGRSIRDWQAETGAPRLPLSQVTPLLIDAPKEVLTPRIAARFDQMMAEGLMDEVAAMAPRFDPRAVGMQAIGADALIAHLRGEIDRDEARDRVVIATRRYAKAQRTMFRGRLHGWRVLPLLSTD